jgi:hypothetical protein
LDRFSANVQIEVVRTQSIGCLRKVLMVRFKRSDRPESNHPILSKAFQIRRLAFAGKETIPLQAADTPAFEIVKQVANQIVDKGSDLPEILG